MDRRASMAWGLWRRGVYATAAAAIGTISAQAQSLPTSMAQAYQVSPQLNAARAQQRATDEGVPQAQGGQRTTVDVLNAQGDLMAARARLIGAQRDRIIASYTLLSAIGHLDVKTLNLNTPDYLPEAHYHQIRDSWGGLRTPSGR